MKHPLSLLLAAVSGSTIATDRVNSVPTHFLGEWNAFVADCGGTGKNDSVLEIQANHISYWESDGPIKAIVVHGRHEIALISELSGEGEVWLSATQFKLSPEGDKLVWTSSSGDEFVRYRCPRVG